MKETDTGAMELTEWVCVAELKSVDEVEAQLLDRLRCSFLRAGEEEARTWRSSSSSSGRSQDTGRESGVDVSLCMTHALARALSNPSERSRIMGRRCRHAF